jgi:hypothetical protein
MMEQKEGIKNHENRNYRIDFIPYCAEPGYNEYWGARCMIPNMPLVSLCSITHYWQWYALTILLPGEIMVQTPGTEKIPGNCNNPWILIAK